MTTNVLNEFRADGTSEVRLAASPTAGVINTLTFNGTVSSLTSVSLPTLTIAGTGILDVNSTSFAANTTIAIANLRDVQQTHFDNPLVFSPADGLSTFDISSSQGDFEIANAHRFEGTGFVNLVKNNGDAITITVPGELNGDSTPSLTTGYRSGDGVTLVNAPPAAGINTVTLDTTIGGYYAIRANSGQIVGAARFEAGATISHDFSSNDYAVGNPIDVYVKYDSDISTRTIYQETLTSLPFQAGTTSREVGIPAPVAATLVASMETTLAANVDLSVSLSTGGVLSQVVRNSAAETSLGLAQSQGLTVAATIANSENYFDAWYDSRALAEVSGFSGSDPIFRFLQNDIVRWDNRRVTFASGNESGGFRLQHTINNWEQVGTGTFALSRTGAAEVLPLVSGAAPIATVIAAVDSSQTAMQVGDIHNFNGRLAENPLLTEPAGGFETSGRYDVNIERT